MICDIYSGSTRLSSNEFPKKISSGLAMFSSSIGDRSNSSDVLERPRSAGMANTTVNIAANSITDRGVTLSVSVFSFVVKLKYPMDREFITCEYRVSRKYTEVRLILAFGVGRKSN